MDTGKFANTARSGRASVVRAQELMEISKSYLNQAKELRKEAEKAEADERTALLIRVMEAARNSKDRAAEAQRLVAS